MNEWIHNKKEASWSESSEWQRRHASDTHLAVIKHANGIRVNVVQVEGPVCVKNEDANFLLLLVSELQHLRNVHRTSTVEKHNSFDLQPGRAQNSIITNEASELIFWVMSIGRGVLSASHTQSHTRAHFLSPTNAHLAHALFDARLRCLKINLVLHGNHLVFDKLCPNQILLNVHVNVTLLSDVVLLLLLPPPLPLPSTLPFFTSTPNQTHMTYRHTDTRTHRHTP